MRARYAAHVLGLVDFVIKTYHPSCEAHLQEKEIAESIDSDWVGLNVVSSENGSHENEGFVTFQAYLSENGEKLCMQERSRFIKEENLWYYIDGTFPEQQPDPSQVLAKKPGRNDPCLCGSGKKFKKCCG